MTADITAFPIPAIKRSELSVASSINDSDKVALLQGTVNKEVTATTFKSYVLTSVENAQTGTSYTLVLSDEWKLVTMSNAGANTLTVPPNSSVAFPVGTRIDVGQDGSGQTTIAAGVGVTIHTPETLKIRKQWGKATLFKRDTDTWDVEGNLEAAP